MKYIILLIIYIGLYSWLWKLTKSSEEIKVDKFKFFILPIFIVIGSIVTEIIVVWIIGICGYWLLNLMYDQMLLFTVILGLIHAVFVVMIRCLTMHVLTRFLIEIKISIWVWIVNVLVIILSVIFEIGSSFYVQSMFSAISENNFKKIISSISTPNICGILNQIVFFIVPIVTAADVLFHKNNIERKTL